jgi:hypothetical protein
MMKLRQGERWNVYQAKKTLCETTSSVLYALLPCNVFG